VNLFGVNYGNLKVKTACCAFQEVRSLKYQERLRGGLPPIFGRNDGKT
jgi:hypothetical protein